MPGSVPNTVTYGVLPQILCTAFQNVREIALMANDYRNGESQRSLLVSSSRRKWVLAVRLPPALLDELRAFYVSHLGPTHSFYFYDPFAVTPIGSNFDITGTSSTGRVTVRFDGEWQQSIGMARTDAQVTLVEVN